MEAQANPLPIVLARLSLEEEEDAHHPHRGHPTTTQLQADPATIRHPRLTIDHSHHQESVSLNFWQS